MMILGLAWFLDSVQSEGIRLVEVSGWRNTLGAEAAASRVARKKEARSRWETMVPSAGRNELDLGTGVISSAKTRE